MRRGGALKYSSLLHCVAESGRVSSSLRSIVLAFLLITSLAAFPSAVVRGSGKKSSSRHQSPNAERQPEDDGDPASLPEPESESRLREIEDIERESFNAVNLQRESRGLEPLKFSPDLLPIARRYSKRMAEEGFFSHSDPQGRTLHARLNEAGIRWRMLGENLGYSKGWTSPAAIIVHQWMGSPGHRRNLLEPQFRQSAIGAWISTSGIVYLTEVFIR